MKISRQFLTFLALASLGAFVSPALLAEPASSSESPALPAPKSSAKHSASGSLTVESDWCGSREDAIRNALYKGFFEEIYTKAGTFSAEVVSVKKKGGQVSVKMQISWGQ